MTYSAIESSRQLGSPVELLEFQYGFNLFRYTNQDRPYVVLSKTFLPVQKLERTALEESTELARNDLTITVPRDLPIAELFRVYPPSEEVSVTLYRVHRNDPDQEMETLWVGRVLNARWHGAAADLHCENLFTSFKRKGLRRLYQKACPHVLYGQACRVDRSLFRVVASVTAIDGAVVTAPNALTDGWFAGGFIEWEKTPDNWERRWIKDHVGDEITLNQPIHDLVVGASLDLYPGCAHDKVDCDDKFNNILNYGGFTDIPQKNPFNTSSGAF